MTVILFTGVTLVGAGDGTVTKSTHTDSILIGKVLEDGDWQMNLANDCLRDLFRAGEKNRTSEMLHILALTDFDLTKVTVKEVKQDPSRIRFGFEFNKRKALKTVYWEAECPVNGHDPAEQQTTTAAVSRPAN